MVRITVLGLLAFVVGCGGKGGTEPPATVPVPGVYDLTFVNSAPLPYLLLVTNTQKDELTSETLTLGVDGSLRRDGQIRTTYTSGGTTYSARTITGTYVVAGATISTSTTAGAFSGAVGSGIVTLDQNVTYRYVRQP